MAGDGVVAWLSLHLLPGFDEVRFLLINAVAWPSMLVASLAIIYIAGARWIGSTLPREPVTTTAVLCV